VNKSLTAEKGETRSARWPGYIVILIVLLLLVGLARHYLIGGQADQNPVAKLVGEIMVPDGYERAKVTPDSFGEWLRNLPLKPPSDRIMLYNGKRKPFQHALYQLIDLPIGDRDLQQCADVAIRLRSDYLRDRGRINDIAFNFTNGDRASYADWIDGYRPIVEGNRVSWQKSSGVDSSYANYLEYLNTVFMYAGSYSLSRELKKVDNIDNIKAGDCFIEGGFPGHVVIVADVAINKISDEKIVLFAQGFTPAQDIHIIRNPSDNKFSPWYKAGQGQKLITPEWTFEWSDLYSF
jgi:hypothetical protein